MLEKRILGVAEEQRMTESQPAMALVRLSTSIASPITTCSSVAPVAFRSLPADLALRTRPTGMKSI